MRMERISMLLQKISAITEQGKSNSTIDIDLALDYTRVLYADLLEMRSKLIVAVPPAAEPTLAELTDAMQREIVKETQPIPETKSPILPSIEQKPAPQPMATTKNDIRTLIGINDKYLFISELFGNDKDGYEQLLDEINGAWDEDNALHLLKEHTGQYDEEESEALLLFYGLVNKFFSTI